MDFQNLVKAMIKPLKWQESPTRLDAFFAEHYSVFKDRYSGIVYLEIQDYESDTPYASFELAKAAADEHNRGQIMAALAEIIDFDPEQAFKQAYPNAMITFNADGWSVRKTPNLKPFVYAKTRFEALCKALAI